MAGIIAIYGLVVAVLIAGNLEKVPKYDLYTYVSLLIHPVYTINLLTLVDVYSNTMKSYNVVISFSFYNSLWKKNR